MFWVSLGVLVVMPLFVCGCWFVWLGWVFGFMRLGMGFWIDRFFVFVVVFGCWGVAEFGFWLAGSVDLVV